MKKQKKSIAAFLAELDDEPIRPNKPEPDTTGKGKIVRYKAVANPGSAANTGRDGGRAGKEAPANHGKPPAAEPERKSSKQQWLEEMAVERADTPASVVVKAKINGHEPFEPLPVRPDHIPKKHPPGTFKRGDVCFYRGERMWVEYAPADWSQGFYARITDQRVHPDENRMSNDDKRLTFCVHVDCLEVAPQPKNPYAKVPTVASVARAERAKAGIKDAGDPTAILLRSATTIDELYKIGAKALGVPAQELRDKYAHLNPGQQRMNIGNRMRAKYKKEYRHAN